MASPPLPPTVTLSPTEAIALPFTPLLPSWAVATDAPTLPTPTETPVALAVIVGFSTAPTCSAPPEISKEEFAPTAAFTAETSVAVATTALPE